MKSRLLQVIHFHSFIISLTIMKIVSPFNKKNSLMLQLLGIILGFSYARTLRSKKTQRDMQIWNTDQGRSNSGRQPIDHSTIQW